MSVRVTSLPDAEPRRRRIAIGTFDGVHVGHRAVIGDAETVLTFEPHPLQVILPVVLRWLIIIVPPGLTSILVFIKLLVDSTLDIGNICFVVSCILFLTLYFVVSRLCS